MQEEYIRRINKVLIHIDEHLDNELSLQTISNIACYSPFHLHRLFKAITNETLNNYITRKRIERAALLLIHHPEYAIADIAGKYGFNSDVSFSRTFKKLYGISPSEFRKRNRNNFSKIGKGNSNIGKVSFITEEYLCNIINLKNWIKMNASIEITQMPKMNLAYITQIGENGLENAFQKIVNWAAAKQLLTRNDVTICRVFHDSFKVTDAGKVRMSIGVISPEALSADGEIGLSALEGGKTITARFVIEPKDFENAWNSLFIWMSENGYKKSDQYPFEMYHNNYNEHPEKKCIVDLCIPII